MTRASTRSTKAVTGHFDRDLDRRPTSRPAPERCGSATPARRRRDCDGQRVARRPGDADDHAHRQAARTPASGDATGSDCGRTRDRGRRRRRLGDRPRRHGVADRPAQRARSWRRSTSTPASSRPAPRACGSSPTHGRRPHRSARPTASAGRSALARADTRDIAVGGGTVWVTDEPQGLLWRIEPRAQPAARHDRRRRRRELRRLRCGRGLGRQLRLRNRVARSTRARTASPRGSRSAPSSRWRPAPASAWVSTAGGTRRRARCRRRRAARSTPAAATPDVLIASDLPLQGQDRRRPRARWSTRSGSCSSSTATAPGASRSATSRATSRRRRPATSTRAAAPRTR